MEGGVGKVSVRRVFSAFRLALVLGLRRDMEKNVKIKQVGVQGFANIGLEVSFFLTEFQRMPTANAEGWIEWEGGIGKVSVSHIC